MLSLVVSVVVSVASGAIADERLAPLRLEARASEARWSDAKLARYAYRLRHGGPFGYTEYQIQVNGTKCSAKSRYVAGRPQTRWRTDTCEGHAIADLFIEIRSQLERPQERVELMYEAAYGFPTAGSFEPHTDLTDTSSYFVVERFMNEEAPNKSLERPREG